VCNRVKNRNLTQMFGNTIQQAIDAEACQFMMIEIVRQHLGIGLGMIAVFITHGVSYPLQVAAHFFIIEMHFLFLNDEKLVQEPK